MKNEKAKRMQKSFREESAAELVPDGALYLASERHFGRFASPQKNVNKRKDENAIKGKDG